MVVHYTILCTFISDFMSCLKIYNKNWKNEVNNILEAKYEECII